METDMNAENVEIALLSDDTLNAVAGGECGLDFARVPCPIGHLEVTTTNCPGVDPVVVRYSVT
jgi:hypothetical protein